MLNEEQYGSIQYSVGREQFQMDEFSLGLPTAKSFATTFAQSEAQDDFIKGYVDGYHARIAPVLENI